MAKTNAPRVQLTADTCVIDEEEDYFIRGVLRIPILDAEKRDYLGYGV